MTGTGYHRRYGDVLKAKPRDPWRVMYLRPARVKETGGVARMFVGMTIRAGAAGQKVGNITFFPEGMWKLDD